MYRNPAPGPPPPDYRELDAYEAQLHRAARRKKIVWAAFVSVTVVMGIGMFFGPICYSIGSEEWRTRKTKLTPDEMTAVSTRLDKVESDATKSQAAFALAWPKIRNSEIGPRSDLGTCKVDVPGPSVSEKDDSVALNDSVGGARWVFVDLTAPEQHSPIASLEMPSGSFKVNNSPYSTDRYVLPPTKLETATGDKAPTLASTTHAEHAKKLRTEAAGKIRHDGHRAFVNEVKSYADDRSEIDVLVFVDLWENPKFDDAAPSELTPREKLKNIETGADPVVRKRIFESGMALARAFAWDSSKAEVVCASQAFAFNSQDIKFRSSDISPLNQDLVLQLEQRLQQSFVAVGDHPTKLEAPTGLAKILMMAGGGHGADHDPLEGFGMIGLSETSDAGAPDEVVVKPKKKKKKKAAPE